MILYCEFIQSNLSKDVQFGKTKLMTFRLYNSYKFITMPYMYSVRHCNEDNEDIETNNEDRLP